MADAVWIAQAPQCWHYACMSVQITIRDVPEKVRDELAARAALQGNPCRNFFTASCGYVARPSVDAWLQQFDVGEARRAGVRRGNPQERMLIDVERRCRFLRRGSSAR